MRYFPAASNGMSSWVFEPELSGVGVGVEVEVGHKQYCLRLVLDMFW